MTPQTQQQTQQSSTSQQINSRSLHNKVKQMKLNELETLIKEHDELDVFVIPDEWTTKRRKQHSSRLGKLRELIYQLDNEIQPDSATPNIHQSTPNWKLADYRKFVHGLRLGLYRRGYRLRFKVKV